MGLPERDRPELARPFLWAGLGDRDLLGSRFLCGGLGERDGSRFLCGGVRARRGLDLFPLRGGLTDLELERFDRRLRSEGLLD